MMIILNEKELNDFVNPDTANNGGGYHQPAVDFMFNGKKGYFEDTSCGDFGKRYFVEWDGFCMNYDEVGNEHCYSEFSIENNEHKQLAEELKSFDIKLFI